MYLSGDDLRAWLDRGKVVANVTIERTWIGTMAIPNTLADLALADLKEAYRGDRAIIEISRREYALSHPKRPVGRPRKDRS